MKRLITLGIASALALSACGLKVPVTVGAGSGFGGTDGVVDPGLGGGLPGTDLPGGPVDLPGGDTGGVPGGDTGGDTGGPVSGGDTGGGDLPPGQSLFANETEGINNDQITMCSHVPITGAAPLARNAERFGQFYWNYVNAELGGVHGRKVRFLAFDDQYNPTGGRAAFEKCRREGAFIYFGAAGTDQIVSVAKLAEQYGVPYFHGPTSDKDMKGFRFNVHTAPTYEDQHRYLARYLVDRYGKDAKYGMIRVASVFFEAGHDAYVDELRKLGVQLVVDREVQKDEKSFSAVLTELQTKGVTVVNNFTTPSIWINMIPQAGNYRPTWTAVSPIAGFNLVANTLGPSAKAVVFQHFNPGCNCSNFEGGRDPNHFASKHIERFVQIFKQYSPEQSPQIDDFDYGAYISMQALHRQLEALGPNPTRTGYFQLLKNWKENKAQVTPGCPAQTRGERRLGHAVNILELSGGKWKNVASCVDVGG